MKFTVLLLYPEHMTDGDTQTFQAHVHAQDADEAAGKAQDEAREDFDYMTYPFQVLAVYAGHHDDIKPEQDHD